MHKKQVLLLRQQNTWTMSYFLCKDKAWWTLQGNFGLQNCLMQFPNSNHLKSIFQYISIGFHQTVIHLNTSGIPLWNSVRRQALGAWPRRQSGPVAMAPVPWCSSWWRRAIAGQATALRSVIQTANDDITVICVHIVVADACFTTFCRVQNVQKSEKNVAASFWDCPQHFVE